MAIDIKSINEITFTQSFRGYNTEEVDDFLDDLYEEASQNNREIDELKKKLKALEGGGGGGVDQEEAYAVIANAQEEADKIVEAARQKAHAMIERAENQISENANAPAPTVSAGVDTASLNRLKDILRETYEKQMAAINAIAGAKAEPEIKQPQAKREVPSVSFSGITKQFPTKIPAERDILSEINAIGLESPGASDSSTDMGEDTKQPPTINIGMQETQETNESPEPETGGLAFSFAEHDEPEEQKPQVNMQYKENEPEDPDDIIAQILRDNNRN